jgi:sigma-E factor negative regulatory protein RseC
MYEPQAAEMKEEGVVRSVTGGLAVVETVRQEACSGCGAQGACHALGGGKERVVTARNQVGAQVGDRVLLGIPSKGVLSAGFLVYLLPVAALMGGAAMGKALAPSWGIDPQGAAVGLGIAALSVCWLALRWISRRLAGKKMLTVRVIRILGKGETDALDQCSVSL